MIDPVIASRLQFAVTTIVHIIFPVMSMGLAPFLIYFTWKEIRTGAQVYEQLRTFWTKIFAISFVVGTVTGIVLEFEFGTNFAAFATAAGELFGGPLALEGMMAFMLEATFLGIFVFGRDRVTDRLYMLSSVLVGLGTWLSAVWILVANSWMQTPRGYEVATESGQPIISLVDPIAAYANPRFPWMYVHMQNAAVLSVALFLTGVAAYFVWTNRDTEFWRTTMKVGLAVLLVTAPFQAIHGDAYGRHVADTQPQKFAAMEAQYETDSGVGLKLVAIPTSLSDITDPHADDLFVIEIPFVASLLASGNDPSATITGLSDIDAESPPVAIVFWAFRAMVGLGTWFILLAFWGGYRWYQGTLFDDDLLAKAFMGSSVLGIFTVELGWIVTEVGRQPWVIQGVMKTHAGVSSSLTGSEALATLVGFVGVYTALLVLYWYVVIRLIRTEAPTRQPTPKRETNIPEGVVPSDD
ncbi:cytochrome ubiquinol oxidase subunit I [Natrinema hispanicum]|uniref:Cytochrome bd-I ubiquinol oxidase subunit 1 apoprotein n=1 Tax=Natrinema hispanicum TaxID=392421 RepID=A0A1H9YQ81_9EURY|nr:cytochrome ubiquinol oxidase subunit I [Natrinema hispanicum]SDC22934.1 cytochrome bd-I ubiquinol oxidase subunit 1 apoprotein [Natrinema hispanicum]SES71303.1 cytochrome bd-I ubiquinol oxidase subunit 1 apoprotein [Natrinema hispanicum]